LTDKPNEEAKQDAGTGTEAARSTPVPIPDEAPASTEAAVESAAAAVPPADTKVSEEPADKRSFRDRIKVRDRTLGRSGIVAIVLGVLVVLLALMLFLPGIMPVKFGAAKKAANAETEQDIEAVASRFAKNLLTFDYRTLREDLQRIAQDATGTFEREFEGVSAVSGNVVEAEAVSKGEVQAVSVTSRSDDSSIALVFLQRTIENKSQPEPRTQFQFLELTLVSTSDGWKVDDVKDPTLAGL
jgi:Mce-associated membrane protein